MHALLFTPPHKTPAVQRVERKRHPARWSQIDPFYTAQNRKPGSRGAPLFHETLQSPLETPLTPSQLWGGGACKAPRQPSCAGRPKSMSRGTPLSAEPLRRPSGPLYGRRPGDNGGWREPTRAVQAASKKACRLDLGAPPVSLPTPSRPPTAFLCTSGGGRRGGRRLVLWWRAFSWLSPRFFWALLGRAGQAATIKKKRTSP